MIIMSGANEGLNPEVLNARIVKKVIELIRAMGDNELFIIYNQAIAFRQQQLQSLGSVNDAARKAVIQELIAETKVKEAKPKKIKVKKKKTSKKEESDE